MKVDKCKILKENNNIAVIGISRNSIKTSRAISRYLVENGYNVVGVNPDENFTEADGIIVYNSLDEIPHKIDIVNVFRRSEDIPFLIDDILSIKPKVLWLQLGIRNDKAVEAVIENNITVIQDSCIKVDHSICS